MSSNLLGGLADWQDDLLRESHRPRTSASRGRGSLSPDTAANVRLSAWSTCAAMAIAGGVLNRSEAVARLALAVPCRPDLVDQVLTTAMSAPRPAAGPVGDWPPRAVLADVLTATREVTMGQRRLVGPDGVTVEHVILDRGPDRGIHRFLRLRRANGAVIAEVTTIAELAKLVPLDKLHEADPESG